MKKLLLLPFIFTGNRFTTLNLTHQRQSITNLNPFKLNESPMPKQAKLKSVFIIGQTCKYTHLAKRHLRKTINILLLTTFTALTACAVLGSTSFTGQSTTYKGDNILRNDLFNQIRNIEHLKYNCNNITSIYARINHIEKQPNGRVIVGETWTTIACGTQHHYPIILREDEKGETDFAIQVQ